jgi:hypothetical protein
VKTLTEFKGLDFPKYEKLQSTCVKKYRAIFGDTSGRLTPEGSCLRKYEVMSMMMMMMMMMMMIHAACSITGSW